MKSFLAQVDIGEQWYIKPDQKITQAPQFQTTGALISIILKNVYMAAGVFLLFLLIFGGISIILGAGGGDPKKAGQGQKAITAAIGGFFLIFASYWIIQLITYLTGIQILSPIIGVSRF